MCASPLPGWASYPGVAWTLVGEEGVSDALGQRLAYFVTRDAPEAVLGYFTQDWRRRGVPTTRVEASVEERAAAGFFLRAGMQQVVVAVRQGDRTFVFRAEVSWRAEVPEGAQPSESFLRGGAP